MASAMSTGGWNSWSVTLTRRTLSRRKTRRSPASRQWPIRYQKPS